MMAGPCELPGRHRQFEAFRERDYRLPRAPQRESQVGTAGIEFFHAPID
jgi:hypothetical protein